MFIKFNDLYSYDFMSDNNGSFQLFDNGKIYLAVLDDEGDCAALFSKDPSRVHGFLQKILRDLDNVPGEDWTAEKADFYSTIKDDADLIADNDGVYFPGDEWNDEEVKYLCYDLGISATRQIMLEEPTDNIEWCKPYYIAKYDIWYCENNGFAGGKIGDEEYINVLPFATALDALLSDDERGETDTLSAYLEDIEDRGDIRQANEYLLDLHHWGNVDFEECGCAQCPYFGDCDAMLDD